MGAVAGVRATSAEAPGAVFNGFLKCQLYGSLSADVFEEFRDVEPEPD